MPRGVKRLRDSGVWLLLLVVSAFLLLLLLHDYRRVVMAMVVCAHDVRCRRCGV
jgi:hypothetical protein